MNRTVFISYASSDAKVATAIAKELKALGIEYFVDKKDVNWGDRITEKLRAGLIDCNAVVVVVSPASLKSQWVPFEIGHAKALAKPVLPFLVDPAIELPSYLHDTAFVSDLAAARRFFTDWLHAIDEKEKEPAGKMEGAMESGAPLSFFDWRSRQSNKEKARLAEHVVNNYLAEGASIAMDAGSSVHAVARAIYDLAVERPSVAHFSVMTHNYPAFRVLENVPHDAHITTYLAGGRYDLDLNAFFGAPTEAAYLNFFPQVVLLGLSGLVANFGLFCHNLTEEASLKKILFGKRCVSRIIVAEGSKLGRVDSFCFATAREMTTETERCILATTRPDSGDTARKEAFEREVEMLRAIGVKVDVI